MDLSFDFALYHPPLIIACTVIQHDPMCCVGGGGGGGSGGVLKYVWDGAFSTASMLSS